jgi:hypothetical protein
MLFLYSNRLEIYEAMRINKDDIDRSVIEGYKKKMKEILKRLYPANHDSTRKQFEQMERYVAHDLLTETIILNSRGKGEKTEKRIFSKEIPRMQWHGFIEREARNGRRQPDRDAEYKTYAKATKRKQRVTKQPPPPIDKRKKPPRKSKPEDIADHEDPEVQSGKLIGNSKMLCIPELNAHFNFCFQAIEKVNELLRSTGKARRYVVVDDEKDESAQEHKSVTPWPTELGQYIMAKIQAEPPARKPEQAITKKRSPDGDKKPAAIPKRIPLQQAAPPARRKSKNDKTESKPPVSKKSPTKRKHHSEKDDTKSKKSRASAVTSHPPPKPSVPGDLVTELEEAPPKEPIGDPVQADDSDSSVNGPPMEDLD